MFCGEIASKQKSIEDDKLEDYVDVKLAFSLFLACYGIMIIVLSNGQVYIVNVSNGLIVWHMMAEIVACNGELKGVLNQVTISHFQSAFLVHHTLFPC
jgi:hypothetical protein